MPDGEIPSIVFDRADMVMADGSPSANSQVRTIAMACPNVALNVGIFFDGTYNNAANVTAFDYGETAQTGGSYDNSHTNVFRLSLLYFGADQNTRAECGSIDTAYHSAYVEGIGSSTGGDDSGYAAATGHGPSGLEEKLDKGVRALRQFINQHGGLDNLRDVNVDVFGFSRGSATARVFCNAIVSMNEPKVNVRFLGIYDTVGSFGIPGNDTEMTVGQELARAYCDVPLNINPMCWLVPSESTINMNISGQSARSVFHVVADDEFRQFFPSTSAQPGHAVEVTMPGCHGDVAGASPQSQVTETHENPPQFLVDRGYFQFSNHRVVEYPFFYADKQVYTRTVYPALTAPSFNGMLQHALQAGVPLHRRYMPTDPSVADLDQAMRAGRSLPQSRRRNIAARHAHSSHGGLGPNMLAPGGHRESYPNRP